MRRARFAFVLAAAMPSVAFAAPDRDTCIAASEDGQTLKIKGQLTAARAKLAICADDACPRMVKQDCVRWMEEIDVAMPTIVLGARDGDGHDLVEVSVQLDGAPLATILDGTAVPVDPGPHTLRFEAKGLPARQEQLVTREGEKNRTVNVTLGEPTPEPPPAPPPPTPPTPVVLPPPPPNPVHERLPVHRSSALPWVLGGVGLVAFAVGVGVGVGSIVYVNGLRSGCGRTPALCQQSDIDLGWAMYAFAGINDGLGGALLLTSAILLFTHKTPTQPVTSSIFVAPSPRGLSLAGTF